MENLRLFTSLRVRYLLVVIKETLGMPDVCFIDVDVNKKKTLLELCDIPMGHDCFDLLVTFDSIQFDHFWVKEWAALLSCCSCAAMMKKITDMHNVQTVDAPSSPQQSPQQSKKMLDVESVQYVKKQGRFGRFGQMCFHISFCFHISKSKVICEHVNRKRACFLVFTCCPHQLIDWTVSHDS